MNTMVKEFSLYIRRCHICDALNEHAGLVGATEKESENTNQVTAQPPIKCGQCGKFLAPFIFSDPELVRKQLDKHAEEVTDLHRVQNAIYPPLIGLAIYW